MTSDSARLEVQIALRDGPFQYGPFGEQLSVMAALFLGSQVSVPCPSDSALVAAAGEDTIPINWNLPMTDMSQAILFARIRISFEKATAIIQQPSDRKRYRMAEEELMLLRNRICFWTQVRQFCSSRMNDFADFDRLVSTSNSKDAEFQEIMELRPPAFGVSMLPCAQKQALEQARIQEEGATMDVEKERLKVRDTRWAYFQAALARDQRQLMCVKDAPQKVESLKHRKATAWRLQQAQLGERVVSAYMDKFLRCEVVGKAELAQQRISEYRSFVAPWFKLTVYSLSCSSKSSFYDIIISYDN